MKQCNCRENINKTFNNIPAYRGGEIVNWEMVSGKTYSTFKYEAVERGKVRKKETLVLHSYCPFCGEKYVDETLNLPKMEVVHEH